MPAEWLIGFAVVSPVVALRVWMLASSSHPAEWLTAAATTGLALVTAALAAAAWKALAQIKEVRSDRHVRVFLALGERWTSQETTDALQMQAEYTPEAIADLFVLAAQPQFDDNEKEAARIDALKKRAVLARIPTYFEDTAMIAKAGALDGLAIRNYVGGIAIDAWLVWEPTIRRLQESYPPSYRDFEELVQASIADDASEAAKTASEQVPARAERP